LTKGRRIKERRKSNGKAKGKKLKRRRKLILALVFFCCLLKAMKLSQEIKYF